MSSTLMEAVDRAHRFLVVRMAEAERRRQDRARRRVRVRRMHTTYPRRWKRQR